MKICAGARCRRGHRALLVLVGVVAASCLASTRITTAALASATHKTGAKMSAPIARDSNTDIARSDARPSLLLVAAYPAPHAYATFHTRLNGKLAHALGPHAEHAYLYDASSVHVTIATLHGAADTDTDTDTETEKAEDVSQLLAEARIWDKTIRGAVEAARNALGGRTASLRVSHGQLSAGGVGIVRFRDEQWVKALRDGLQSQAEPGLRSGLRVPGIVHSSVLRWRGAPGVEAVELRAGFERAVRDAVAEGRGGGGVEVAVTSVRVVVEGRALMRDATVVGEYEM